MHQLEAGGVGEQKPGLGVGLGLSSQGRTSSPLTHQVMGGYVASKDLLRLGSCHLSSCREKYMDTCTSIHSSVGKLRFRYKVLWQLLFLEVNTVEFLKGVSELRPRWLSAVLRREREAGI